MKKSTTLIAASVLLVLFQSCSPASADKKVPEIAAEMCSCFDKLSKNLSKDEMDVLKTVSLAGEPQAVLTDEFRKMNADEANAFAGKIQSVGDKNSDVFKCIADFDKRHGKETTKDKKALTEKLLIELQSINCTVGAAVVNLSLGRGVK